MAKIIRNKAVWALGTLLLAVFMITMLAYPAFIANAQAEYRFAFNQENWTLEEYNINSDTKLTNVHTITVDVKGSAFVRMDEETLKQYMSTTSLVIKVQPATQNAERQVEVMGSVKVNDVTYTIDSGKAFLRTGKNFLLVKCQGVDESGNQISLKIGARYFGQGEKTFALRSIAILQTVDKPMLLLQRGNAGIQ